MDGRIIVILFFLFFFVVFIILGIRERSKTKQSVKLLISKNWGSSQRRISGDFQVKASNYSVYYSKKLAQLKPEDYYVDDITASDLSLDEVFLKLNHTYSAIGEQYLYKMLRIPFASTEKDKFISFVHYFQDERNEAAAKDIQYIFYQLGKGKNNDLFKYLDNDNNGKFGIASELLLYCAYILSIILIFTNTGAGIIVGIVSLIVGVLSYFRVKGRLNPFINPAFYIIKLISTGKKLLPFCDCSDKYFNATKENISKLASDLSKASVGASYVFLSANSNKNMFTVIVDYINMVFHFDIILFYIINKRLLSLKERVFELYDELGLMESAVSIASYRRSLEFYSEPVFSSKDNFITELTHPLLKDAVRNDLSLDSNLLISGSNASGKSTYLKAVALNIILAEAFNTALAREYSMNHYRVYTSMALRDSLSNGESFFMAEIKSIKRIIDKIEFCDIPIIAFIDEILRGTNTIERIAASGQITAYLNKCNVKCVFATHDLELTKLLDNICRNVHFSEDMSGDDVKFTYKLLDGPADTKNAIKLLKNLGYDSALTENASRMAAYYENNKEWKMINE